MESQILGIELYSGKLEVEVDGQKVDEIRNDFHRKKRRACALAFPTAVLGLALTVYGGIHGYMIRNPPLESPVHEYVELVDERKSLGYSGVLSDEDRNLKDSLEYRINELEKIDEVEDYNRSADLVRYESLGGVAVALFSMCGLVCYVVNEFGNRDKKLGRLMCDSMDKKHEREKALREKAFQAKYEQLGFEESD